MTGADFKKWAERRGYVGRRKVELMANDLGVSFTTAYLMFRRPSFDRFTLRALANFGVEPAQAEICKAS